MSESLTHSHRTEAGGEGEGRGITGGFHKWFPLQVPSSKPHPETTEGSGHRGEVIISAGTDPNLATLSSGLPGLPRLGERSKGAGEGQGHGGRKLSVRVKRRRSCPTHGCHRETRLK